MMNAAVVHHPGGPEVLRLERRSIPVPQPGHVLINVKAFGLNRSELYTRQGHSPGVVFPRILGIEAVGIVEQAPGGEFNPGDVVATVMGDMGRAYDGGYAEYTCVPATQIRSIETPGNAPLPWPILGALPEMLQTAWGSLFKSLQLSSGDRLLIRGGTTSVGLAAAAIARKHGTTVISTTRNPDRQQLLLDSGAENVVIDNGEIEPQIRALYPDGVDKVLELVGTLTLLDSLRCTKQGGIVSITGIVGNEWSLDGFNPMEAIPTGVHLTSYSGTATNFLNMPFNDLVSQVVDGTLPIRVGKTFRLGQIVEAHRYMETNTGGGKIVVLP